MALTLNHCKWCHERIAWKSGVLRNAEPTWRLLVGVPELDSATCLKSEEGEGHEPRSNPVVDRIAG